MVVLGIAFFVVAPLSFYLSGRKLKQPVVSFTTRFWSFDLFLLLLLAMPLFLVLLPVLGLCIGWVPSNLFKGPKQEAIILGIGLASLLLGWGFVGTYLRLYWSYWQHDRTKSLTFYKDDNLFRYWQGDEYSEYAMSEVLTRTRHDNKTARLSFSYTILSLSNGAEVLVTNLLCDASDLAELLPNANAVFLKAWFPWLPKAAVNQH